jgi:cellulose synthase/poly-beta-1,6-N-acetylglucosamine synthase-like glycosyltransferase
MEIATMKRFTWSHVFFGLFGIVLSTGFFFFALPKPSQSEKKGTTNSVVQENVALLLIQPKGDAVNLRQQPRLDSEIVGIVGQGAVFEVTEVCGDTLGKIGRDDQWVKGRTADGIEGYTAAWLYTVVGVNNYTTIIPPTGASTTTVTTVQNKETALSVCQGVTTTVSTSQDAVVASLVTKADSSDTAITTEASADAHTDDAQVSSELEIASDSPETESGSLYLKSLSQQGINVRSAPVDGVVVGVVDPGDVVEVIESADQAASKIDAASGWIMIRAPNGIEGYVAAWLFDLARNSTLDTPEVNVVAVTPQTPESPLLEGNQLYLTPHTDIAIRVRAAPVNGAILDAVSPGTDVLVIEPVESALEKIGLVGEWVLVRTKDGVEGYTAADLYTVVNPVNSGAPEILPLESGAGGDTGFLPVQESEVLYDPNSIAALQVVPSASRSENEQIAPVNSGILELNVSPSGPASKPSPEAVVPKASEVDPSSPLIAVEPGQSETAINDLLITGDEIISGAGSPRVVGPVNNIIPITVTVTGETQFESAEIAINDRPMARFYEQPYEFDLDASQLSKGDYRLTFTAVSADDMLYADEVYFEIALDNPAVFAEGQPDAVAEVAAMQRVVLIDNQERPLTLEFSVDDGLVPTAIEQDPPESPHTLGAIWGRPISSLIPYPIRAALAADRPVLASVTILVMLILLLPQGIFTIYWMTYTWNNPRAADDFRSPKEFMEPQFSFTALLPARREEDVIKDTIYAVDRINYPDHLKEILILIRDEDDDGTINAAREAIEELGKDNIRLVTFTEGPKNKPNGLNRGLKVATKDVVCIFDAEDEPHPDIYNVVNTVMIRDESDVVQSGVQLMNFKSTWFSSFNVLEYFLWFKSGLHAFTREFGVTPLGGNTVFFKRYWLERTNGWDDQCLTEDGDIGIRLTSLGAKTRIVYEAEHATQEETPDTVESFIKQRTRWCQGFYQIFLKGEWRQLPKLKQRIVALYILLNSVLQASMIVYIPIGAFMAFTQSVPVPIAMISYVPIYVLIIQLIINLVSIREFTSAYGEKLPRFFSLKMILYFYPYQLMLSVAAIRAVYRMLKRQNSWEKTAHSNLHRQNATLGQVGA